MTPAAPAHEWLTAFRTVYDAANALRRRRLELQTVEQAMTAFTAALERDQLAVDEWRHRKEALELEWRERQRPAEPEEAPAWSQLPAMKRSQEPTRPPAPPVALPRPVTTSKTRRHFARFVNRLCFTWQLDTAVLGQINCIVDDVDRPLGEALVLLPWSAFTAAPHEAEAAHRARLQEWGNALEEYQRRLESDVSILEARFLGWLGVWEWWRGRERDAEGRRLWEAFIEAKRHALRDEATRLEAEVADRQERLKTGSPKQ